MKIVHVNKDEKPGATAIAEAEAHPGTAVPLGKGSVTHHEPAKVALKRKARETQQYIEGTEPVTVPALERLGSKLREIRSQAATIRESEQDTLGKIILHMRQAKMTVYDGAEIVLRLEQKDRVKLTAKVE